MALGQMKAVEVTLTSRARIRTSPMIAAEAERQCDAIRAIIGSARHVHTRQGSYERNFDIAGQSVNGQEIFSAEVVDVT